MRSARSGARSRTTPSTVRSDATGRRASAGSSPAVWLTLIPMPRTTTSSRASASTPATLRRSTMTSFGHLIWTERSSACSTVSAVARPATSESCAIGELGGGRRRIEVMSELPAGAVQRRPSPPPGRPAGAWPASSRPRPRTGRDARNGRAGAARPPRARASRARTRLPSRKTIRQRPRPLATSGPASDAAAQEGMPALRPAVAGERLLPLLGERLGRLRRRQLVDDAASVQPDVLAADAAVAELPDVEQPERDPSPVAGEAEERAGHRPRPEVLQDAEVVAVVAARGRHRLGRDVSDELLVEA